MGTATAKRAKSARTDEPRARYVYASATHLEVELVDGRKISVPIEWYPRLATATPAQRNRWELLGRGTGIHWPDLDEDLSVEGIVAGRRSGESQKSFKRWLRYYRQGKQVPVLELPLPDWAK